MRPRQRSPPPKKKDRVAKLHYITRHVRNGCHHIFKVMHSRHEKCGCNKHFNIKRSQPQDSDAVYGESKFNFSRNLWNIEICYFARIMLSSSFFFFSIQRFLWMIFKVLPILLETWNFLYRFLSTFSRWCLSSFFDFLKKKIPLPIGTYINFGSYPIVIYIRELSSTS